MVQFRQGSNPWASLLGGAAEGAGSELDQILSQKRATQLLQAKAMATEKAKEAQRENIAQELIRHGVPEEQARLYSRFTTGGQTEYIKHILESQQREGGFGTRQTDKAQQLIGATSQEKQPPLNEERLQEEELFEDKEPKKTELQTILEDTDRGLLPKEKVKAQEARKKTNEPLYLEAGEKLRTFAREKERFGILDKLNDSDKLPKNFGRFNVEEDGSLKFPFIATPEAQRFVKTINDFASTAKDSYGARVTNFDLTQHMRRYPSLLNSKEGRKQLIQQMQLINDINSVYYKNLQNVYDKAGGVKYIDADRAEYLARKQTDPQVEKLAKKFSDIGQPPGLPSPSENKGRKIRNTDTGEIMQSDGEQWLPVGK